MNMEIWFRGFSCMFLIMGVIFIVVGITNFTVVNVVLGFGIGISCLYTAMNCQREVNQIKRETEHKRWKEQRRTLT
jgi:hypothetical protein